MTTSAMFVPILQRLDFDALVPVFSRAVSDLDDACVTELDRAGIEPSLRELVRLRASQINGCAYCVDMHSKAAAKEGVTQQRLHAVAIWPDSALFTARERAAMQLTESVTRLSETHVPEHIVAEACDVFGEEATTALVTLILTINLWNGIGVTTRCWTPARDAE